MEMIGKRGWAPFSGVRGNLSHSFIFSSVLGRFGPSWRQVIKHMVCIYAMCCGGRGGKSLSTDNRAVTPFHVLPHKPRSLPSLEFYPLGGLSGCRCYSIFGFFRPGHPGKPRCRRMACHPPHRDSGHFAGSTGKKRNCRFVLCVLSVANVGILVTQALPRHQVVNSRGQTPQPSRLLWNPSDICK